MQTYPIQTGPSAPPTTFILASQLGLALNCDLMTGLDKTTGLVAADDGPAINAAMAGATAHNPLCLVMDGGSAVSALHMPAGGHWGIQGFGNDTGFFACTGTNNILLQNGALATSAPGNTPAPARGANVFIRDIFINGNHGNGTNGNCTTGDSRGTGTLWYFSIYLVSLDHILIQNVHSYNAAAFQLVIENCGDWIVDGCRFDSTGDNTDGIHINGPSNDGRISNCYIHAGDDPIALNAPEGFGGLITRIAISDCIADYCRSLGRMYTMSQPHSAGGGASAAPKIDGVTWSNYQASSYQDGFYIGLGFDPGPGSVGDSITNVSFIDCKFVGPSGINFNDSVGTVSFDSCSFATLSSTLFWATRGAFTISALNIGNCRVLRSAAGITTSLIGSDSPIPFKRVAINGLSVVDVGGYSGAPVAGLLSLTGGATLGQLQIDAVDASNIAALVGSGASPTAVAGGGVLQTGWQIADAVVANSTPYLSSNASGAPSIKVAGVAKRLALA